MTATLEMKFPPIIEKLKRALGGRSVEINICYGPSTGRPLKTHYTKIEERTPVKNLIISRIQAKRGRKFGYLSDNERNEVTRMMATAISNSEKGQVDIAQKMEDIGKRIVAIYQKHIDGEMSVDGPMTPLKEYYRKYLKPARYGDGLPTLEASGQLRRALFAQVNVIK